MRPNPLSLLAAVALSLGFSRSGGAGGATAKLTWAKTDFLFTFGDSYTTEGFNISAGIHSPTGKTSSNGPNWVQFLGGTYNGTNTKVFDLASGGATIDSSLVPPGHPTIRSIVEQVSQFTKILAPKPPGAVWNSNNSLFAIWIGINDVGKSFSWTNITQPEFYPVLLRRLETQLDELYNSGARSFLFLTVPPTNRAPKWLQQGPKISSRNARYVSAYNTELTKMVKRFEAKHGKEIDQLTIFDTQPVFDTLLDNAKIFGFVNETGWCTAYENGTPNHTTQIAPCAPVSSYFWLNSLHPVFTVHDILAKSISTVISRL